MLCIAVMFKLSCITIAELYQAWCCYMLCLLSIIVKTTRTKMCSFQFCLIFLPVILIFLYYIWNRCLQGNHFILSVKWNGKVVIFASKCGCISHKQYEMECWRLLLQMDNCKSYLDLITHQAELPLTTS